jgi:two-component system response regulator MprA
MRILLVDDHREFRTLLRQWLSEPGWDIVEARSGEEALERRDEPFDVLIIDHRLGPGADGLDVARRLREAGDKRPILVCSANISPALDARAREVGVEVALKEDFAALRERVRELGS